MKIADLLSHTLDKARYAESTLLNNSNCFVGVELELEGLSPFSFRNISDFDRFFWHVDTDGSLRNGTELKFNRPLKGGNIDVAIKMFEEAVISLKNKGVVPKTNERTSMHVHVDVRDLSTDELQEMVMVYLLLESTLFNYVGYHRVKNNYCRPLIGSDFTTIMNKLISDYSDSNNYVHFINDVMDKYSALNVRAVAGFGSVEFRHHPGTYDSTKIISWIDIVISIKEFVVKGGRLIDIIDVDFYTVLSTVFPSNLVPLLNKEGSPELFRGTRSAIVEAVNAIELKSDTAAILRKSSKAKPENKLINKFQSKIGL